MKTTFNTYLLQLDVEYLSTIPEKAYDSTKAAFYEPSLAWAGYRMCRLPCGHRTLGHEEWYSGTELA